MYVFPCKNKGECRRLEWEKWGKEYPEYAVKHGVVSVWVNSKHGFEVFKGRYKCCTGCHLPLNQAEATLANKLLGNTLEEITFDDEFLELLNGI